MEERMENLHTNCLVAAVTGWLLVLPAAALLLAGCEFGDEPPEAPLPTINEGYEETVPEEETLPEEGLLSSNASTTKVEPIGQPPKEACLPVKKSLYIENRVDGKSQLEVQGYFARYHHYDHAAPGLHRHDANCQLDTDATLVMAHDPTFINGKQWWPEWPEGGENRDCHCDSSFFKSDELLVPAAESKVTLNVIRARGEVAIIERPTAANGYRLTILWDDNPPAGCDFYEIELVFEYVQCEEEEPMYWCEEAGYCEYDCPYGYDNDCDSCGIEGDGCMEGCEPPDPDCVPYAPTWCEEQFDTEQVCVMGQVKCLFYTVLDGGTCAKYCAERGGECVSAYHDLEDNCSKEGPGYCDEPAADQLCECLREPETPPVPSIVVQLEVRWGWFHGQPFPGAWTAWDGGISVSDGTVVLDYPIFWDKHDVLLPQADPAELMWESRTRPHNDGLRVTIKAASLKSLVTIKTTVDTFVLTAESLALLNMIVIADDLGNEVRISSVEVN